MSNSRYKCLPARNLYPGILAICLLACIFALPSTGQAREFKQRFSPVCATADFNAFLEAYVLVPKEEQMSCIRFSDFTYKGKKISTPQELIKSEAAVTKLLFSRDDINASGRADAKFFYTLPMDMVRNGPGYEKSCYVIRVEGKKRYVSLTLGGTFPLETIGFEWDGSNWRVLSVVQEDIQ